MIKKLVTTFTLFLPLVCNADVLFHQGSISEIKVFQYGYGTNDATYVEVSGTDTLGSCKMGNTDVRVVISDEDTRQYSLLLAAALSEKEIVISVDENDKNSQGFCYLRNVRLVL